MGHHVLTSQQRAMVDAACRVESFAGMARAGTGKTSTISAMSYAIDRAASGLGCHLCGAYLAYNRAIVDACTGRLPQSFRVSTAHSLAFRGVPASITSRCHGTGSIVPWKLPGWLGIGDAVDVRVRVNRETHVVRLKPGALAACAKRTVRRYCESADLELGEQHVWLPSDVVRSRSLDAEAVVLAAARLIWADAQLPTRVGKLKFEHDYYLKMWANRVIESGRQLGFGVIFLDEGQDANPTLSAVLDVQQCQKIVVGDSAQSIYGWRGAVDTLEKLSAAGTPVLPLTRSFRFGAEIAEIANLWLPLAGCDPDLTGNPQVTSTIGPVDPGQPHAVLCRTNLGVVSELITALADGHATGVIGNIRDVTGLIEAGGKLKRGETTTHPQLMIFQSWDALLAHTRSDLGEDDHELQLLVRLLSKVDAESIVSALRQAQGRGHRAHVTVGTAHGTKGLEFDRVRIASDWTEPDPEEEIHRSYARLAYVACTRARHNLDLGGLQWIFDRS